MVVATDSASHYKILAQLTSVIRQRFCSSITLGTVRSRRALLAMLQHQRTLGTYLFTSNAIQVESNCTFLTRIIDCTFLTIRQAGLTCVFTHEEPFPTLSTLSIVRTCLTFRIKVTAGNTGSIRFKIVP